MTENSKRVLDFLKENYGKEFTKREIAEESGVIFSAVNGSIRGLSNRNYIEEREEEVVLDGKRIITKYVKLNDAGLEYDPEEEEALKRVKAMEERAAKKAAKKAAQETEA